MRLRQWVRQAYPSRLRVRQESRPEMSIVRKVLEELSIVRQAQGLEELAPELVLTTE